MQLRFIGVIACKNNFLTTYENTFYASVVVYAPNQKIERVEQVGSDDLME
jgi:hypothetical protein